MTETEKKTAHNERIKQAILAVVGIALCAGIALMPPFPGLEQNSMLLLAILFGIVYFMSTKLLDEFLAGSLGFIMLAFFHITDMPTTFSGLAHPTVILLFGAFGMGSILAQTKVLERISQPILRKFAPTYKGRVNALTLIGTIITPLIPSTAAKGIIMSNLAVTVSKEMGYKKGSQAATGLFMAGWVPVGVLGVCFLSGNIYAPLISGLVEPNYVAQFSWVQWFVNALVFWVVMAIGSLVATKILYKPRPDELDESLCDAAGTAKAVCNDEPIREPMTRQQKISATIIGLCLVMWIFSASLRINDAWVALVGFVAMVLLGCADKKKVLTTNVPWGILIFVAFTISLSTAMTITGLDTWMTNILGTFLIPLMSNIWLFIPAACIAIYLVRLVIVSQTLVVTALFIFLMPVGIAAGIHPWIIGFICISTVFTWNILPQSIPFFAAFGATDGYLTFSSCVKMSVFLMAWTIVSLLASVAFWMFLGLL